MQAIVFRTDSMARAHLPILWQAFTSRSPCLMLNLRPLHNEYGNHCTLADDFYVLNLGNTAANNQLRNVAAHLAPAQQQHPVQAAAAGDIGQFASVPPEGQGCTCLVGILEWGLASAADAIQLRCTCGELITVSTTAGPRTLYNYHE